MKFSGKSQESLNSPISLILLHSVLIRSSLALIRDLNLSFFFFNEAARMVGADVDEPRCFKGGSLGGFFGVGSVGNEEVELKTGWFDKMVLVEVDEGGIWGGSQRWRRVKKEEKKIIRVKGLKIILAPS